MYNVPGEVWVHTVYVDQWFWQWCMGVQIIHNALSLADLGPQFTWGWGLCYLHSSTSCVCYTQNIQGYKRAADFPIVDQTLVDIWSTNCQSEPSFAPFGLTDWWLRKSLGQYAWHGQQCCIQQVLTIYCVICRCVNVDPQRIMWYDKSSLIVLWLWTFRLERPWSDKSTHRVRKAKERGWWWSTFWDLVLAELM